MKVYDSNMLRNIAVLGHSGCGKTNLIEAIAYTSNLTNKISKQNDKVNMTYTLGLVPVEYNNYKYNLLDTPGYFDFCGEVISSLTASDAAIIVIDATTGQNGMLQAKAFKEVTDVSGIILTKLDGTSKGGIVLAIRHELGIPIKFIGLGEKLDDLMTFDIEQYLYGLFTDFFEE